MLLSLLIYIEEDLVKTAFARYLLLLGLLFIFWSEFFVAGGALNQLAFNFAVFYPLGFLVFVKLGEIVGKRTQAEN